MQTSEQLNEIGAALAKAQEKIGSAVKNAEGKGGKQGAQYTYNYADLAQVLDIVRPELSKNGIALVQDAAYIAPETKEDAGGVLITSRLLHSSGQWIEASLMLAVDASMGGSVNQKIGSAISYGRRYLVSAQCMVAQADPDSADTGNGIPPKGHQTSTQPRQSTKIIKMDICPKCDKEAVITDKYKGGLVCWPKQGGCGERFKDIAFLNKMRANMENVGSDVGDLE